MPIYHPEPGDDAPGTVRRRSHASFALQLLQSGPVTLYCSRSQLETDAARLQQEDFALRRLRAARWGVDTGAHDDLQATLGFPDYYGKNLNALADCLLELEIRDEGGLAIVLEDFDEFAAREPDFATGMLDVLAHASRLLQVFAKTLLVLVHSKDPDADFGPLGAVQAQWNPQEFLREGRGQE